MTRFSATAEAERRTLFTEAIEAHRTRGSPFVTVEADPDAEMAVAPWVQYADEDGLVNLDCTDAELPAIETAVDAFGGATITDRTTPEDADGTNLKVAIEGDPERVAMLVDSIFRDGFGLEPDYRAWIVEL